MNKNGMNAYISIGMQYELQLYINSLISQLENNFSAQALGYDSVKKPIQYLTYWNRNVTQYRHSEGAEIHVDKLIA